MTITLDHPTPALNGHQLLSHEQQASSAREYIQAMLHGSKPQERPEVGKWQRWCDLIESNYVDSGGDPEAMRNTVASLSKNAPELARLLAAQEEMNAVSDLDTRRLGVPPLPDSARLPDELSRNACPWLDRYIEYSKLASPEGFEHFHLVCGLWLLSTVAAGRVKIPLGTDGGHTSLYVAMVARTSLFTKTTTAKVAKAVLRASGVSYLLGLNRTTPQKLLSDMAGTSLPGNYGEQTAERQEYLRNCLAFSGQRGLYFDELGKLLQATMNGKGVMVDFQPLLLELDDTQPSYGNGTVIRGAEAIDRPYVALLGSMTTPNLKIAGKAGSDFWTDGLWARFAFICPPRDAYLDVPMTEGLKPVPDDLRIPLKIWHERLGIPNVVLEPKCDEKGQETGKFTMMREPLPEVTCSFGSGVWQAWANYRSAVKSLIRNSHSDDLERCTKGLNYGKLAA